MSTTPNDRDRIHNEDPSEGEESPQPEEGREHSQEAAEGDEGQS